VAARCFARNKPRLREKIMGKKKIIAQSEQDVLREEQELSAAQKKAVLGSDKIRSRRVEKARAFIQSSYNNTILTLITMDGDVLAWASSGGLGFKGPKKATPFAASKVAEAISERAKKMGIERVTVFIKGIGSGRESALRSLAAKGLEIISIKDITPIPHNGCRPPKVRRV